MRTREEIEKEMEHITYAKAMLDGWLASVNEELELALKAEAERLNADTYAKDKAFGQLAGFFRSHGYLVTECHTGARTKDLYKLARQIWEAREVLCPFIKELAASKEEVFRYGGESINPLAFTHLKNLCENLLKLNWLTYQVDKSKRFEIKPNPKVFNRNFLQGGWAEEATIYLIDKTLKALSGKRPVKHRLFWDVKLTSLHALHGKTVHMQLDLIAQVEDNFYIFETKAGNVLAIDKWVDRTRLFGSEISRFITCTTNEHIHPMLFAPYRLFNLPTLEKHFTTMLERDLQISLG